MGFQGCGGDGFKPFPIGIGDRGLVSLQSHQIHGVWSEVIRWVVYGVFGANTPEGSTSATVLSKVRSTAAFPETIAFTGIQMGEQVGVWAFSVMIQAQVDAVPIHYHIAGSETGDGDVVDEAGAEVKLCYQIVPATQGNTVMSGAFLIVQWPV